MPVPTYRREDVRVGIVHVGVGGFHRAHEAMYVDRLMNGGEGLDWGICGVGVLPGDAAMRDALTAQDGLYTLVIKQPDGSLAPRVIGSIVEYLLLGDDPEAVIEKMAAETTRIVSLTVTEGGYNVHPVSGQFDERNQQVLADAQADATPTTVFGLVTEALVRRRERGVAPFTVMSCDNIQGNGDVAARMFTAFARLRSEELADWMAGQVAFPNSMVDRITPVTTDDDRAQLAERFGVDDAWPVVCEPFTQWVLEDHFGQGRPALQDADVQLVHDVMPYELMKLRLLNAGHQAIAYLGYLSGYRYAHEVSADPAFSAFLRRYMDDEATPTLRPVPGVDLEDYKATLVERFANPQVRDTLARLCAESSDRIPKWVLPVIREQLAAGREITCAATIVAAWARYAEAVDEQGEPITVVDRLSADLTRAARAQRRDPTAFIAQRELFGDLGDDERFVASYTEALESLHTRGAAATVAALADRVAPA
ncbi:MAG: mannitol dehydrogenase family protein [bacterium]